MKNNYCQTIFHSFGNIRILAIVSESDAAGEFYSLRTIIFHRTATHSIDSDAFASCHLKYIIKNVRNSTRHIVPHRYEPAFIMTSYNAAVQKSKCIRVYTGFSNNSSTSIRRDRRSATPTRMSCLAKLVSILYSGQVKVHII